MGIFINLTLSPLFSVIRNFGISNKLRNVVKINSVGYFGIWLTPFIDTNYANFNFSRCRLTFFRNCSKFSTLFHLLTYVAGITMWWNRELFWSRLSPRLYEIGMLIFLALLDIRVRFEMNKRKNKSSWM